jgi:CelD/BcsL family acetyltransferase involved in cellulose biosynthesis
MYIQVIEELDDFVVLRSNWDMVYKADPEAQFFLSWQWLFDWLTWYRTVWFVLAAKRHASDAAYVAFLPIRMHTLFDKAHGFTNALYMAGAGFSDYTGILARREFEAEAVPAFAEYLKRKLNWARFTMDNLTMSERRRRLFMRPFDKMRFTHTAIAYKNAGEPTDHSVCLSIELPGSWDEYLNTLSPNNRQKIRRLLRKTDAAEDFRITLSAEHNVDAYLTLLLDFWKIKWAPSKGPEKIDQIARNNHLMLTRSAENGTLFLPVFWHGDRPVAALASLVDTCKKSLLFFIAGRDEAYREMPAGYLLHAYSIRHAIAQGFATYDFLKGDEPYKYLFAPRRERRQKAVTVATKTNRNLGGRLDLRGLPAMVEMTLEFQQQGETADAEHGYRQILALAPDHALALFRFGRLMAENGAHAEAKKLLTHSVEVEPEGDNTWFWLARSLQSLGEDQAALEACRKAVKLCPQNHEAKELVLELSIAATPAGRSATPAVSPAKVAWPTPAPRAATDDAAFRPPPCTPEIAEALRFLTNRYRA